MIYVLSIQQSGTGYKITLPKRWVQDNLKPGSKIIFMVSGDAGELNLFSEEVWHERYLSKNRSGENQGSSDTQPESDRSGFCDGAGGEYQEPGITPADNSISRL